MLDVINITKELIERPSVTPKDEGCQELLIGHLERLGFSVEKLPFGEVSNFWARRGKEGPVLAFAGHTDVVPTGPEELWSLPPFKATIRDNYLYGRGAADMKGSIAAMLVACEQFIEKNPHHKGSIAFLITSDEEGPSVDGAVKVVEHLQKRGEKIDWCIVGEPTCEEKLGDMVKIGRRGTLSGKLIIQGKQGHIAYPHLADNPIHKAVPFLAEVIHIVWDKGNEHFQPTNFQVSNIHAGTGAGNVIPANLTINFNFRYSPMVTAEQLQQKIINLLEQHKFKYDISWQHSGKPFLTAQGELVAAVCRAIKKVTDISPILSTSGGTSDGRFIAATGTQVIEFGPCNKTIHQIDECVATQDLIDLVKIYENILELLK